MFLRRPCLWLAALWAALPLHASAPPEVLAPLPVTTLRAGGNSQIIDLQSLFRDPDPGTLVRVNIRIGTETKPVDFVLFDQDKPITVANFLAYINAGRYADNIIHRSVPGFIIQGGGFRWTAPPNETIESVPTYAAIQNEPGISNLRGTIAMAKLGGDPNSATSQWFVNIADNSGNLDLQNGGFTVFARVLNGLSVFDEIAALPRTDRGGALTDLPVKDFATGGTFMRSNTVETDASILPPLAIAPLTFSATSSLPSLLAVSLTGTSLQVAPAAVATGTATITVVATDPGGTSTTSNRLVTLVPPSSGWRFDAATGISVDVADFSPVVLPAIPLSLGVTPVGGTVTRSFTFKNRGTSSLSGLKTTIIGENAAEFTISTPLGSTSLAAGASTTFTIAFKPTAAGGRLAAVRLATGDPGQGALDLALSGGDIEVPVLHAPAPQVLPATDGFATVPDYRGTLATATDNTGVTSFQQTPSPGTQLPVGTVALVFTAADRVGLSATVQTTLTVQFARPSSPQTLVTAAVQGALIPLDGSLGLPEGSKLTAFGVPAISDQRDLAARVTIKASGELRTGIYGEDAFGVTRLYAYQTGSTGVIATTFKSFLDPVLSPGGAIAFGGKMSGPPTTEDEGVWTDLFGPLQVVLREGKELTGLTGLGSGVKLLSVTSLSISDEALLALVKLRPGPGVTISNDTALLRLTGPASGMLLARTGAAFGSSTITGLGVLKPAVLSPGQGRWDDGTTTVARLALANGHTTVVRIAADGVQTPLLQVGALDAALELKLSALGFPAYGGPGVAVQATEAPRAGLTTKNDTLLLVSQDGAAFSVAVRENDTTEVGNTPFFAAFADPAVNDQGDLLFQATLRSSPPTAATGLWWKKKASGLVGFARQGSPAQDASGANLPGIMWSGFSSYALPDGPEASPLFQATLTGTGVTTANNKGLWSVSGAGVPRLLLRTGSSITMPAGSPTPTKKLASFAVLKALPGSFGARRSYNATGSVAVMATFTDATQALLRLDTPP